MYGGSSESLRHITCHAALSNCLYAHQHACTWPILPCNGKFQDGLNCSAWRSVVAHLNLPRSSLVLSSKNPFLPKKNARAIGRPWTRATLTSVRIPTQPEDMDGSVPGGKRRWSLGCWVCLQIALALVPRSLVYATLPPAWSINLPSPGSSNTKSGRHKHATRKTTGPPPPNGILHIYAKCHTVDDESANLLHVLHVLCKAPCVKDDVVMFDIVSVALLRRRWAREWAGR